MNLHPQEVVSSFETKYAEDALKRLKEQLIDDPPQALCREMHIPKCTAW
jgi:hypothetical protein